jgi:hypothetical protein
VSSLASDVARRRQATAEQMTWLGPRRVGRLHAQLYAVVSHCCSPRKQQRDVSVAVRSKRKPRPNNIFTTGRGLEISSGGTAVTDAAHIAGAKRRPRLAAVQIGGSRCFLMGREGPDRAFRARVAALPGCSASGRHAA